MSKTLTLRLDDEESEELKQAAAERPPSSNPIATAALGSVRE